MAGATINGNYYSFADAECALLNLAFVGFTTANYGDDEADRGVDRPKSLAGQLWIGFEGREDRLDVGLGFEFGSGHPVTVAPCGPSRHPAAKAICGSRIDGCPAQRICPEGKSVSFRMSGPSPWL